MDCRHGLGRVLGRRRVEVPRGLSGDLCYKDVEMGEQRKRPFASISAADLRSDDRLEELYVEAVRRGWWQLGNAHVLEFWCLAEKAVQDDTQGTPGKLFHALVRDNAVSRVTDGQEQRAQRRMPSEAREALVLRAGEARGAARSSKGTVPGGEDLVDMARDRERRGESDMAGPVFSESTEVAMFGAPSVGYQHSVMMMCFLPQKRPASGERKYVVRHGKAALQVSAGDLANPEEWGDFKECALPFGSRARLILPYINAFAVRGRTREVDLGDSLRQFLGRLGMTVDGRRGREVTEQVEAIAAAEIRLGVWNEDRVVTKYGRVADAVSFWLEKDADQRTLWQPAMWLSKEYYDVLIERPVPVDMGHLTQLTRSPRRMDLYSWLTYRTSGIGEGRQVRIKLSDLQPVFAPDIESRERLFKQRLRQDLAAVGKVYSGFKVSMEGDVLVLERSPPPVERDIRIALPR